MFRIISVPNRFIAGQRPQLEVEIDPDLEPIVLQRQDSVPQYGRVGMLLAEALTVQKRLSADAEDIETSIAEFGKERESLTSSLGQVRDIVTRLSQTVAKHHIDMTKSLTQSLDTLSLLYREAKTRGEEFVAAVQTENTKAVPTVAPLPVKRELVPEANGAAQPAGSGRLSHLEERKNDENRVDLHREPEQPVDPASVPLELKTKLRQMTEELGHLSRGFKEFSQGLIPLDERFFSDWLNLTITTAKTTEALSDKQLQLEEAIKRVNEAKAQKAIEITSNPASPAAAVDNIPLSPSDKNQAISKNLHAFSQISDLKIKLRTLEVEKKQRVTRLLSLRAKMEEKNGVLQAFLEPLNQLPALVAARFDGLNQAGNERLGISQFETLRVAFPGMMKNFTKAAANWTLSKKELAPKVALVKSSAKQVQALTEKLAVLEVKRAQVQEGLDRCEKLVEKTFNGKANAVGITVFSNAKKLKELIRSESNKEMPNYAAVLTEWMNEVLATAKNNTRSYANKPETRFRMISSYMALEFAFAFKEYASDQRMAKRLVRALLVSLDKLNLLGDKDLVGLSLSNFIDEFAGAIVATTGSPILLREYYKSQPNDVLIIPKFFSDLSKDCARVIDQLLLHYPDDFLLLLNDGHRKKSDEAFVAQVENVCDEFDGRINEHYSALIEQSSVDIQAIIEGANGIEDGSKPYEKSVNRILKTLKQLCLRMSVKPLEEIELTAYNQVKRLVKTDSEEDLDQSLKEILSSCARQLCQSDVRELQDIFRELDSNVKDQFVDPDYAQQFVTLKDQCLVEPRARVQTRPRHLSQILKQLQKSVHDWMRGRFFPSSTMRVIDKTCRDAELSFSSVLIRNFSSQLHHLFPNGRYVLDDADSDPRIWVGQGLDQLNFSIEERNPRTLSNSLSYLIFMMDSFAYDELLYSRVFNQIYNVMIPEETIGDSLLFQCFDVVVKGEPLFSEEKCQFNKEIILSLTQFLNDLFEKMRQLPRLDEKTQSVYLSLENRLVKFLYFSVDYISRSPQPRQRKSVLSTLSNLLNTVLFYSRVNWDTGAAALKSSIRDSINRNQILNAALEDKFPQWKTRLFEDLGFVEIVKSVIENLDGQGQWKNLRSDLEKLPYVLANEILESCKGALRNETTL